jgi:hypothetical protein
MIDTGTLASAADLLVARSESVIISATTNSCQVRRRSAQTPR